jgi:hypothetical protein
VPADERGAQMEEGFVEVIAALSEQIAWFSTRG